MTLCLDTETLGLDFNHGARPYFVTMCDGGEPFYWEWQVDPLTRQPLVPKNHVREIRQAIDDADEIVGQNIIFDSHALRTIGIADWPWHKTQDTLIASHLLASNRPHNLTALAVQYLGINIEPLEDDLENACQAARRWCRTHRKQWRIAKKGEYDMPSATEKCWKYDTWLPKLVAQEQGFSADHPWHSVAAEYANADSQITLAVWQVLRREMERRGLWEIYLARMQAVPVVAQMERTGVTLSERRLHQIVHQFQAESTVSGNICVDIAAERGYELKLPKSGNSKSLTEFVFGSLQLPVVKRTETFQPSLDKDTLAHYAVTVEGVAGHFIKALQDKRKRDTAIGYGESYERFWIPTDAPDTMVLFPSLSMTGTDTLRFSSSKPNSQNISKKEDFTLRYAFGPGPGEEWWSMDYQNIELRIPAYESGEKEMIELFERPNDPPYYGSKHLLVFDVLHPEKFKEHGKACKDVYASTWYQYTKNGNFAIQYGAQRAKADATYKVRGAYDLISKRFAAQAKLNQYWIDFANRHGYVETIPDKTVNPRRGYPILSSRTMDGGILPTVPLSHHVQSTAMWSTMKAMIRCQAQLDDWRKRLNFCGRMVLQVHDELVFALPKRACPVKQPAQSNLSKVRVLQKLMEKSGDDIGVPLTVGVEYHPVNWDQGVRV